MIVLGVDPSLTGTGLAVWSPGTPIRVATVDGTRLRGCERVNSILGAILCYSPDLVVMEGPAFGAKGSAILDLAELRGVLRYSLWVDSARLVEVPPPSLKKYATGKGVANKDAVVLAVERRYGGVVKVQDNNQADALVLLAMALHHYGRPLADVPATHASALNGGAKSPIAWPEVDLDG